MTNVHSLSSNSSAWGSCIIKRTFRSVYVSQRRMNQYNQQRACLVLWPRRNTSSDIITGGISHWLYLQREPVKNQSMFLQTCNTLSHDTQTQLHSCLVLVQYKRPRKQNKCPESTELDTSGKSGHFIVSALFYSCWQSTDSLNHSTAMPFTKRLWK